MKRGSFVCFVMLMMLFSSISVNADFVDFFAGDSSNDYGGMITGYSVLDCIGELFRNLFGGTVGYAGGGVGGGRCTSAAPYYCYKTDDIDNGDCFLNEASAREEGFAFDVCELSEGEEVSIPSGEESSTPSGDGATNPDLGGATPPASSVQPSAGYVQPPATPVNTQPSANGKCYSEAPYYCYNSGDYDNGGCFRDEDSAS